MGLGAAYGEGSSGAVAVSFRGAFVTHTASVTPLNTPTILPWDTEVHDTDGFHDNATNNSRMTIPAGMSRVRLSAQLHMINATVTAELFAEFLKNGAQMTPPNEGTFKDLSTGTFSIRVYTVVSHVIDVVEGDYFEFKAAYTSTGSDDTLAGQSWFQIEAIE